MKKELKIDKVIDTECEVEYALFMVAEGIRHRDEGFKSIGNSRFEIAIKLLQEVVDRNEFP